MILSNGMELEVTQRDGKVTMTYTDEFGPSLFGGGCDTIRIPAYDLHAVIQMLQDQVHLLEMAGYNV